MDSAVMVIGSGDCRVSGDANGILETYDLGPCIAVTVYDPVAVVGGLLHFVQPESSQDRERAARNPYLFADTGVPLLVQQICELGADKQRLLVTIAGGAQPLDGQALANLGKKNYMALRKTLWKTGILVKSEEVGGNVSRTVRLEVASGRVVLRQGLETVEGTASHV